MENPNRLSQQKMKVIISTRSKIDLQRAFDVGKVLFGKFPSLNHFHIQCFSKTICPSLSPLYMMSHVHGFQKVMCIALGHGF